MYPCWRIQSEGPRGRAKTQKSNSRSHEPRSASSTATMRQARVNFDWQGIVISLRNHQCSEGIHVNMSILVGQFSAKGNGYHQINGGKLCGTQRTSSALLTLIISIPLSLPPTADNCLPSKRLVQLASSVQELCAIIKKILCRQNGSATVNMCK